MPETLTTLLGEPDAPEALERLYRADPAAFASALPSALAARPDSPLLRAWRARLAPDAEGVYLLGKPPRREAEGRAQATRPGSLGEVWLVVGLGLLAGLFVKLPEMASGSSWAFFSEDWFYPRNILLGPLGAMFLYLLHLRGWKRPGSWIAIGLFAIPALWLNALPDTHADATVLACLHAPLLLWCLTCAAYAGGSWPSAEQRREYVRFFGEVVVFSGLLLLGGGVLLGLTLGLFELLGVPVSWIWEWMMPLGAAAIPVAAAWAVTRHDGGARIMPLLARIFAPLFLVVLMAYLVRMAVHLPELFQDRETLLVYNLLLLSVLGLSVFALSGRDAGGRTRAGFLEWLLAALLLLTVLLDFVGLAAIGDRILGMGLTPNRLAVLGSNLAVLGNLLALLRLYALLLRGKADVAALERVTALYLPVYAVWAALVTFVFPSAF
ncbi:hypothetical protein [Paucidesulfovibrio longus]|uniref:hypothetical protein n=1 Tax=Paucidesulfovibrio longus TaxID=889 RepID=UPI0003B7878C|nr:hypothetical protein [Paucidesulfovibrio longus]